MTRHVYRALLWACVAGSSSLMAQAPTPNAQALSQVNGSITSSVQAGVVFGPSLKSSLVARSKLMMDVLRNQPASARQNALDNATRAAILAADPDAASLLEQDASITGELVVAVADDFAHGTSKNLYSLHTFDRDYDLSFAVAVPGVGNMAHHQVTVRGIGLENLVAVESMGMATPEEVAQCSQAATQAASSPVTGTSAAPAVCSTTGIQRIAVLMVTFPGNTPAYPTGLDQASYWNNVLFGANPSVNGFWNEVSYGQTAATGDIYGPFALPQAYDCTTTGGLLTAALTAATGTVDFTQYNRIAILFPVTSSCYFGGLGYIGCTGASSTINHQYSVVWIPVFTSYTTTWPAMWGDIAHELGHNLGLGHASTLDFGSMTLGPLDFVDSNTGTVSPSQPASGEPDTAEASTPIGAVSTEYGDYFSVMGNGWTNAGPYSSEHRINILGWIPRTNSKDVTTSGTYTLVPAENSSGLRGLHVLRDAASSSWLWLEFHQPTGYYTANNVAGSSGNTLTSGAQLHYETGSLDSLHTYLLDFTPVAVTNNFVDGTLVSGKSWSDPYSLLTISVGAETSSSLGVTVSYDTPCATVSVSATELAAAGGTANLNITAPSTCSWTASSNASWITFPGTTSGTGNATVPFTYAANSTTTQRSSYITAQRQSVPVVQDGPTLTIVGVSPTQGSGASQSFVLTTTDTAGVADLSTSYFYVGNCEVGVNPTGTTNNAAYLYLWDKTVGGSSTGIVPGSSSTSTVNSCTLSAQGSSVVYSGNQEIVTLNLSFPASTAGTYPVSAWAFTKSTGTNTNVGPIALGIFTVTGSAAAAEPVFSPAGGTFTTAQTVSITDTTPGAAIYYTTDGSGPTTSSPVYSGPITVVQTETIEAIAVASGYSQSPVGAAAFKIMPVTPVISPNGGTFTSVQTVTITDATLGTTIYYTTNGTAPTTSSTSYTGPITVAQSETIQAFAIAPGLSSSLIATATFTINLPATAQPVFAPPAGTYTSVQTVSITDTTAGATIYYTTDGSTPTTSSAVYSSPITVSQTQTLKAMATATGLSPSAVATAAYTINLPTTATPTIAPAGGTFTTAQTVAITDSTAGAVIYYTTDGSTPTTSSSKYTAPLTVSANETIKAMATATGYQNSSVATALFTILLGTTSNLAASSNSVVYGTSVTLTGTVAPTTGSGVPTGSAKFYDGSSLIATVALTNGTAAYASSTFAVGQHSFTVTYGGDATYATSASTAVTVTVSAPPKVTPSVTVAPSASSITTTQALTVTVTVNGGSGYPTATGTVTLSSGSYTSAATTLSNGSAAINVAAGALAVGTDTLSAQYAPDAGSSAYLNGATGTAQVTVTVAPGLTIAGTSVSLARGATTGNTSTITVTPVGGFTGSVALTAAVTASPSGAQYLPTLSFGATTPATISGTSPATATLTISTTAATSGALEYPASPGSHWYTRAGVSLALVLLFWLPRKRRGWLTILGMLALGFVLTGGLLACGGGSSSSNKGGGGIAGTTSGTYTITVTGTSGSITQTGTVTLTVQ